MILSKCSADAACQKSPCRTFLTSWTAPVRYRTGAVVMCVVIGTGRHGGRPLRGGWGARQFLKSARNPKFSCRGRPLCRPVYIIFGAFFLFPSARVVTLATPSAPPLRYPKRGAASRQRFWVCAPIFHALQSTGFSLPQSAYADSSLVRGSQGGTLNFMRCNTKTGTVHAVPVTLFNSRIRRRG